MKKISQFLNKHSAVLSTILILIGLYFPFSDIFLFLYPVLGLFILTAKRFLHVKLPILFLIFAFLFLLISRIFQVISIPEIPVLSFEQSIFRLTGEVTKEGSLNAWGNTEFTFQVNSIQSVTIQGYETKQNTHFNILVKGFKGTGYSIGQIIQTTGCFIEKNQQYFWFWKSGKPTGWSSPVWELRKNARKALFQTLDLFEPGPAALGKALLLGTTDDLTPQEKSAFRYSGTSHVLALSGMHLSLLAGLSGGFLRKKVSLLIGFIITQAILLIFCFLAGPIPSLYRAWMMAVVAGLSIVTWEKHQDLELLSFSVILSLFFWPWMNTSLSFQLSVLALGGLLFFSNAFEVFLRPVLGSFLAKCLGSSAAAIAATYPLTVGLSKGLCWAGLFFTPPLVFLTSLHLALTAIICLGGLIFPFFPWFCLNPIYGAIYNFIFFIAQIGSLCPILPALIGWIFIMLGGLGALCFLIYKHSRRIVALPIDYDSPRNIQAYLEERGLNTLKRWGQNFLINAGARNQIIQALQLTPEEPLWEIGPGLGALTHTLIEQNHPLMVFEIDPGYCAILKEEFQTASKGFYLIPGDVLKTWREAQEGHSKTPEVVQIPQSLQKVNKVVGNLPYNAASAIIADFLEGGFFPEIFVVTVQKEMAERMKASIGSKAYSSFSVLCQSVFTTHSIVTLKPGSFYPAPEVTSEVVALKKHNRFPELDIAGFSAMVRECFSSRRKTLKNNLQGVANRCGGSLEIWEALFLQQGITPTKQRGETVPVEIYVKVYEAFKAR